MGSFGRWFFDVFKQLRNFYQTFLKLNNVIFKVSCFHQLPILSFLFVFKLLFFQIENNIPNLSMINTIVGSRKKGVNKVIIKRLMLVSVPIELLTKLSLWLCVQRYLIHSKSPVISRILTIGIDFAVAISVALIHSGWSKVIAGVSTLIDFASSMTNSSVIKMHEGSLGLRSMIGRKVTFEFSRIISSWILSHKSRPIRLFAISKKEGTVLKEIHITVHW